jgi:long-chain acyl-CoA synthetase
MIDEVSPMSLSAGAQITDRRAAAMRGGDPTPLLAAMPARYSHLVRNWAERTPDRQALLCDGRVVTYRDLWDATGKARGLLRGLGVRPGDRVLFVAENGSQVVPLLLAASELDAWAVPLNARMSAREVATIRSFAACRIGIYCAGDSGAAAGHGEAVGAIRQETPLGPLAIGPLDPAAEPEPVYPDKAHQTAVLVFTSGTTGEPKGVMLSHQALLYMGGNMAMLRDIGADDVFYNSAPVSHAIGLGTVLMTAFWAGASAELVARFTPGHLIRALHEERITSVTGVPTLFARVLDHAAAIGASLRSRRLRIIAAAGAPLDLALKARIEQAFGLRMGNSYGMTECNPVARSAGGVIGNEVGAVQPGVEIRLVREDGSDALPGTPGEIWVKGPSLMLGYYCNPAATDAVMRPDGRIATGDLAEMDETGALRIVGRTKDLIIRSGFNVYTVEVESVLSECPGVAMAAVIGRPVPGNEAVVAFVQPLPGHTLIAAALADWARERLAPYKRPAEFIIRTELPIGPTGKIMKIRLKQLDAEITAAGQHPKN